MQTNQIEKSWLDYLLELFDSDPEIAGQEYVRIHGVIEDHFIYTGSNRPSELASIVLERVGKRLAKKDAEVRNVQAFIKGFAKNINREERKKAAKEFLESLDEEEFAGEIADNKQESVDELLLASERNSALTMTLRDCFNKLGTYRDNTDNKFFFAVYEMAKFSIEEQERLLGYSLTIIDTWLKRTDQNSRARARQMRIRLRKCAETSLKQQGIRR